MTIEYMWWSSMLLCPRKSTLPHNLRSYHSDVPKIGNSLAIKHREYTQQP